MAGPVVAAAVVLPRDHVPAGIQDSKKLTAKKRTAILKDLENVADIGVGIATVEEIDEINILRASHLAMCRAIATLNTRPDHALIDGNLIPRVFTCRIEVVLGIDHCDAGGVESAIDVACLKPIADLTEWVHNQCKVAVRIGYPVGHE